MIALEPYLVATRRLQDRCAQAMPGAERPATWCFDPLRVASSGFLDLLQELDRVVFGPVGLTLPRFGFFDFAEMPGCVFGFAAEAGGLEPEVAAVLRPPDGYVGPVPVSICIAIPRLEPGHWLVHTLGCLPGAGAEDDEGLLHDTLVAIAARLGMTRVMATAQWDSPALAAHARVAPLRLRAAWLPQHDIAATAVFEHPLGADAAARREWVDTEELEVGEPRDLQGLQRAIESGRVRYVIEMRARADGVRVPVIAAAAGQEPAR